MTLGPVSNYATFLTTVRSLTGGQQNINDLQSQLSTGKKTNDLSFYTGPEAKRLLDLRSEVLRRNDYLSNIAVAQPRLEAYDKILDRIDKLASEVVSSTLIPPGGLPQVVTPSGLQTLPPQVGNPLPPITLQYEIDGQNSRFQQPATYSLLVRNGAVANTFDITLQDGMGGSSTITMNAAEFPTKRQFTLSGGPGSGGTVSINLERVTGPATVNFSVKFPTVDPLRSEITAKLEELRSLLNERVGERYIFSGSRYATEPVNSLTDTKQVSAATFGPPTRTIAAGDTYTVTINNVTFTANTAGVTANPPSNGVLVSAASVTTDDVAVNLANAINSWTPQPGYTALGVTAQPPSAFTTSNTLHVFSNTAGKTGNFSFTAQATVPANTTTVSYSTFNPAIWPLPTSSAPVTDPAIPTYDKQYPLAPPPPPFPAQTPPTDPYRLAQMNVDDSLSLTYGITSNDGAFQELIQAMQFMRAAGDNPGQFDTLVQTARQKITSARDAVRVLANNNANSLTLMSGADTNHRREISALTQQIADIEGIDQSEVAARLQAALTTQQASYSVAAAVQRLSLVNFLS